MPLQPVLATVTKGRHTPCTRALLPSSESSQEIGQCLSLLIKDARRFDAVEDALRGTGTDTGLVSRDIEEAVIQLPHRAIGECLKAIAEALEQIERDST